MFRSLTLLLCLHCLIGSCSSVSWHDFLLDQANWWGSSTSVTQSPSLTSTTYTWPSSSQGTWTTSVGLLGFNTTFNWDWFSDVWEWPFTWEPDQPTDHPQESTTLYYYFGKPFFGGSPPPPLPPGPPPPPAPPRTHQRPSGPPGTYQRPSDNVEVTEFLEIVCLFLSSFGDICNWDQVYPAPTWEAEESTAEESTAEESTAEESTVITTVITPPVITTVITPPVGGGAYDDQYGDHGYQIQTWNAWDNTYDAWNIDVDTGNAWDNTYDLRNIDVDTGNAWDNTYDLWNMDVDTMSGWESEAIIIKKRDVDSSLPEDEEKREEPGRRRLGAEKLRNIMEIKKQEEGGRDLERLAALAKQAMKKRR